MMNDRYTRFSERNRKRCESPNGFNHPIHKWSPSDWMVATFGELGEAANIIKKLNRIRDGIKNRKGETESQLKDDLREELADAFTYLDLMAQAFGFDLLSAAEMKFAKLSDEMGYVEEYRPFEGRDGER